MGGRKVQLRRLSPATVEASALTKPWKAGKGLWNRTGQKIVSNIELFWSGDKGVTLESLCAKTNVGLNVRLT